MQPQRRRGTEQKQLSFVFLCASAPLWLLFVLGCYVPTAAKQVPERRHTKKKALHSQGP